MASKAAKSKQYTNLDLIKADTPFTPRKISKTLHQLEFKLQVEKQYKLGIDKMAKLYLADGDKKSKADADAKKVDSEKKIQLLETALKRYRNLHVLDDVADDDEPGSPPPFLVRVDHDLHAHQTLELKGTVERSCVPSPSLVPSM